MTSRFGEHTQLFVFIQCLLLANLETLRLGRSEIIVMVSHDVDFNLDSSEVCDYLVQCAGYFKVDAWQSTKRWADESLVAETMRLNSV